MKAGSLEFNWLPLSDRKGLSTPRIVFWDADDCGGCLYRRTTERAWIEEFGMDLRDGDIVLVSTHWGEPRPSIIAHEHRHFQQHYLLSLPRIGACEPW